MKLKRIFQLLLIVSMLVTFTGCGEKNKTEEQGKNEEQNKFEEQIKNENEDKDNGNQDETTLTGKYETEEIKLINNMLFYKMDYPGTKVLEEIQGSITQINDYATSVPNILVGNKVYTGIYIEETMEFPDVPDSIHGFKGGVFYFKDGKITLYKGNKSVEFENVDFNKETDFIIDNLIISKVNDGYKIKEIRKNEETGKIELEEYMLDKFCTYDDETIAVKEMIALESDAYGYYIYVKSVDNKWYLLENIAYNTGFVQKTILTSKNVDRIIASSDAGAHLLWPVYTKIDDEGAVYSGLPSELTYGGGDGLEISFKMPDGHKPNEIEDIFSLLNNIMFFVFDNGDVYVVNDITMYEPKETYEMKKVDDISRLNKDGKIIQMVGVDGFSNIYLLMDDNKLYYKEIE